MKKFILIIFLVCFIFPFQSQKIFGLNSVYACSTCGYEPPCQSTSLESISGGLNHMGKMLGFAAVNSEMLHESPCKTAVKPFSQIMAEIEELQHRSSKSNKISKKINGVNFVDENEVLLAAFESLTTGLPVLPGRFTTTDTELSRDAVKTDIQEKAKINPDCVKVNCALEILWGKEIGFKKLWILLKHGFNTSEYAYRFSRRYNADQLNDVIIALEDIPSHIGSISDRKNQRLTIFSEQKFEGENHSDLVANAGIMLFGIWENAASLKRQYILFHEFAHNFAFRDNSRIDLSKDWLDLSDWKRDSTNHEKNRALKGAKGTADEKREFDSGYWDHPESSCFVSLYASLRPEEDFAETATAYRYEPQKLKERCPAKYDFMKNKVFKVEYLNNQACSSFPQDKVAQVQKELISLLAQNPEELLQEEQISSSCERSFLSLEIKISEARDCVATAITDTVTLKKMDAISNLLKETDIPDTSHNQGLVINELRKAFKSDIRFARRVENIAKTLKARLSQNWQQLMEQTLAQAPKSLPPVDSFHWKEALTLCQDIINQNPHAILANCRLEKMIELDENRQRIQASRYFWGFPHPPEVLGNEAREEFRKRYRELLKTELLKDSTLRNQLRIP
jgi:hypothetical protein